MAVLTNAEKVAVRRALADAFSVTWPKAAVDAAAQAVEDLLVNNATAISNAINSASQPLGVTFTAAQKQMIVAYTILQKYLRDK